MSEKRFTLFITLLVLACHFNAQEYKKRYKLLNASNDTAAIRSLLAEWSQKEPNDADLYAASFKYYMQKAKHEKKTKTGELLTEYDPLLVKKSLWYADEGIKTYPNRLDIRFGKIHLLGELKSYPAYTDALLNVIEHSAVNKNAWLWSYNVPQATPRDFMLASVNEYALLLGRTGNEAQMEDLRKVSEAVLKYYPGHAESVANMGSYYLSKKQNEKALALFLEAESVLPEDANVLNNLAGLYKQNKDTSRATFYYERVVRYGEEHEKEQARKELKALNRK